MTKNFPPNKSTSQWWRTKGVQGTRVEGRETNFLAAFRHYIVTFHQISPKYENGASATASYQIINIFFSGRCAIQVQGRVQDDQRIVDVVQARIVEGVWCVRRKKGSQRRCVYETQASARTNFTRLGHSRGIANPLYFLRNVILRTIMFLMVTDP